MMCEREYLLRETARRYYKAKNSIGRRAIRSSFCDQIGEQSAGKLWEMISLGEIDPDREKNYLTSRGFLTKPRTLTKIQARPRKTIIHKVKKAKGGRKAKPVKIIIHGKTFLYPSSSLAAEDLGYNPVYLKQLIGGHKESSNISASYQ